MTSWLLLCLLAGQPFRVFIDAGHGVPGNQGTPLVDGRWEEDVALEISRPLAAGLAATPGLAAELSRTATPGPDYDRRKTAASAWQADALVSVHVDARVYDDQVDGRPCPSRAARRGFLVLYSDWGSDRALVLRRRRLARLVARHLQRNGFAAHDGEHCMTGYRFDGTPGVLIERRVLFILRRPTMPSIIVETHDGLDEVEVRDWRTRETQERFVAAMRAALLEFSGAKGGPAKRRTAARRRAAALSG